MKSNPIALYLTINFQDGEFAWSSVRVYSNDAAEPCVRDAAAGMLCAESLGDGSLKVCFCIV